MDFTVVESFLGNYCFPICMCIYVIWQSYKDREANRKHVEEMEKQHSEEVNRLAAVVENNTDALKTLSGRITL